MHKLTALVAIFVSALTCTALAAPPTQGKLDL